MLGIARSEPVLPVRTAAMPQDIAPLPHEAQTRRRRTVRQPRRRLHVFGVPRLGSDNPDVGSLDDKLGVKAEAHAFARVAAACGVDPPLAFGIFGDWGSGKSFFMRLMQDYIESREIYKPNTDLYHEKIVQIRFNAWHYAETNLWASWSISFSRNSTAGF